MSSSQMFSFQHLCNDAAQFCDFGFFHSQDRYYSDAGEPAARYKHHFTLTMPNVVLDDIDKTTCWASA